MNRAKKGRNISGLQAAGVYLNKIFKVFCAQTSIHGFRFLGDPYRTHGERVFWFFAMCFQIIFCVFSINFVLQKWTRDPVIISFDTKAAPLAEVRFKLQIIYGQRFLLFVNVYVIYSFHSRQSQYVDVRKFHSNILIYPAF